MAGAIRRVAKRAWKAKKKIGKYAAVAAVAGLLANDYRIGVKAKPPAVVHEKPSDISVGQAKSFIWYELGYLPEKQQDTILKIAEKLPPHSITVQVKGKPQRINLPPEEVIRGICRAVRAEATQDSSTAGDYARRALIQTVQAAVDHNHNFRTRDYKGDWLYYQRDNPQITTPVDRVLKDMKVNDMEIGDLKDLPKLKVHIDKVDSRWGRRFGEVSDGQPVNVTVDPTTAPEIQTAVILHELRADPKAHPGIFPTKESWKDLLNYRNTWKRRIATTFPEGGWTRPKRRK